LKILKACNVVKIFKVGWTIELNLLQQSRALFIQDLWTYFEGNEIKNENK
jgi:hypothetical protein